LWGEKAQIAAFYNLEKAIRGKWNGKPTGFLEYQRETNQAGFS
jgi:hypothetical protein